jgi:hypothetical protein
MGDDDIYNIIRERMRDRDDERRKEKSVKSKQASKRCV